MGDTCGRGGRGQGGAHREGEEKGERKQRAQTSYSPDLFIFPPQDQEERSKMMLDVFVFFFPELWRANEITNKKMLKNQHSLSQIKIEVQ